LLLVTSSSDAANLVVSAQQKGCRTIRINLRNEIEPPGPARHGIGLPEVQVYLPPSPALSLLICDHRYYMYELDKLVATDINNVIFQNDWQLR
jgi:hypothetical protein